MNAQRMSEHAPKVASDTRALSELKKELGAKGSARLSLGHFAYFGLALIGWLASTSLITAGCFVILFVMAGNGSAEGFSQQLLLLAQHYLSAPPVARASFNLDLLIASGLVFVTTGYFRRGALPVILRSGGSDGQ